VKQRVVLYTSMGVWAKENISGRKGVFRFRRDGDGLTNTRRDADVEGFIIFTLLTKTNRCRAAYYAFT